MSNQNETYEDMKKINQKAEEVTKKIVSAATKKSNPTVPVNDFTFRGDIADLRYFESHKTIDVAGLDKIISKVSLKQAIGKNFIDLCKKGYLQFSGSSNTLSLTGQGLDFIKSPEFKMAMKIAMKVKDFVFDDTRFAPEKKNSMGLQLIQKFMENAK